jgi:hypothetical protein
MKCFVLTMLLIGGSLFAFSQTTFPYPKSIQGHKNNLVPFPSSKNYITPSNSASNTKHTGNNTAASAGRPDISLISVMPTLRLWLLPANIPNPFMKEEE